MVGDGESGSSGYLPKKLPESFDFFRSSSKGEEGMNRQQVNFRMLFAASLVLVSTVLVSLTIISATEFIIYAYLLLLANFAGYAFVLNRSKEKQKPLPTDVVTVIAVLISTGFTAAIGAVLSPLLPLTDPRNSLLYVVLFLLVTLTLLPEKAVDRINTIGKV
jgi:hypothetical protein